MYPFHKESQVMLQAYPKESSLLRYILQMQAKAYMNLFIHIPS